MRTTLALLLTFTAGCSQFGADSVFTNFADIPPEMRESLGLCQMIEGQASADGIYTNGNAQVVSVVEFNDGCANVQRLETRNGVVNLAN